MSPSNRVAAAPPSKCCCCKTRDGVVIIGISILIFSLITTVTLSHNLALNSDEMYENFRLESNDQDEIESIIKYVRCAIIISLLLALTTAFASVALLWGMKKRKPEYLTPWICVSVPSILFNLVSSFVFVIKVWQVTNKTACVIILVLVFGFYFLWGYCVLVVVRYRKRNRRKSSMTFNDDLIPDRSAPVNQRASALYTRQASSQSAVRVTQQPTDIYQPPLPPYEPADPPAPPPYSFEPSAPPPCRPPPSIPQVQQPRSMQCSSRNPNFVPATLSSV